MLVLNNIEVVYDGVVLVLKGVSLTAPEGCITTLLGANGAGKTTTLRALGGLLPVHRGKITKGSITLDGRRVDGREPSAIVARGITQVMEGRRVFAELTVDQNLAAGPSITIRPVSIT